jgi:hypothetical protein
MELVLAAWVRLGDRSKVDGCISRKLNKPLPKISECKDTHTYLMI